MNIFIIIYVCCVLFITTALGVGKISTFFLIPISFFYFSIKRNFIFSKKNFTRSLFWYFLFTVTGVISIFYANNPDVALDTQLKALIIMFFAFSIYSICNISFKYLQTIAITISIIPFYFFLNSLIANNTIAVGEYYVSSSLNANYYGYLCFIGLSSLFLLRSIKKSLIINISIISLFLIAVYFSLIFASRGTIIIIVIQFILYISIVISQKLNLFKRVLVFFTVLFFSLIIYDSFIDTFDNSILIEKFQRLENVESKREYHYNKAIEIGLDNPIFGIGAGNYAVYPKEIEFGSFSHNSFTEIFANFGFMGLILYLMIYVTLFLKILKNIKNNKYQNIEYGLNLILILFIMQLYSFLYVIYLDTAFMIILAIVFSASQYTYTNNITKYKN